MNVAIRIKIFNIFCCCCCLKIRKKQTNNFNGSQNKECEKREKKTKTK